MSPEFEQRLREAREVVPGPDDATTRRARQRARVAVRRPPQRLRVAALAGAIAIAVGVGAAIGAYVAPSGSAARGPTGLGFLPEPGWFVLQSGEQASRGSPAVAVASNVPFAREDNVRGLAETSVLPYQSLLELPPDGVVLVAVFTPHTDPPPFGPKFAGAKLPLRVEDAAPYIQFAAEVRPDAPLAQYQLRAEVNGHDVDLTMYFGRERPTELQSAAAQRQLERLVVRPTRRSELATAVRPASLVNTSSAARPSAVVVDRTVLCSTSVLGGVYGIEARSHTGVRAGPSRWKQLPFAVVSSGGSGGRANDPALLDNSLAWITAGRPSSTTTMDSEWRAAPVRSSGTLAVQSSGCRPSKVRVPLTRTGLVGGVASPFGDEVDCFAPRRVLVRVRATFTTPAKLGGTRGFLRSQVAAKAAQLAVRTEKGKQLFYSQVFESGKATMFAARSCSQD